MSEIFENIVSKFPTSELPARYGVVSSVIYTRLEALYIKPHRQDDRFYITAQQLRLMDDLHTHLEIAARTEESNGFRKKNAMIGNRDTEISQDKKAKALLTQELFSEWLSMQAVKL